MQKACHQQCQCGSNPSPGSLYSQSFDLYTNSVFKFNSSQTYPEDFIVKLCSKQMKKTTEKVIQHL